MRFLLFLFSLIPALAFAADTTNSSLSLAPPAGDLSVSLLASVFGVVQGVLHGTGSQILGAMFGVYNSIILAMGMTILMYTFIVGTLNTAHEGEVMGKKWSSIWLPARTLGGVALLLPNTAGYSFIQVIVMWVVVQGVGAADLVWGKTLDYLNRGGVIVQPPSGVTSLPSQTAAGLSAATAASQQAKTANAWLIPVAGTIFKSEVCMFALQNILTNKGITRNLTTTLKVTKSSSAGGYVINFPGSISVGDGVNYTGMCGSVSWTPSTDGVEAITTDDTAPLVVTDSRSLAVQQIMSDVMSQASLAANALVPTGTQATSKNLDSSILIANTLYYASLDYLAVMTPFLNTRTTDEINATQKFVTEAKSIGWILAGAYYNDVSKLKQTYKTTEEEGIVQTNFPNLSENNLLKSLTSELSAGAVTKTICDGEMQGNSVIDDYICQTEYNRNKTGSQNSQANPIVPAKASTLPSGAFQDRDRKKKPNMWLNIIFGLGNCIQNVNNVFASMGDIYHAQSIGGNPIIMIAQLGIDIVNSVESIYISCLTLILTVLAIAGITILGTGSGIATGLVSILLWLLPFITMILVPLLVAGATMAYYVPMIPFILFIFGALTWFAGVIEAMLAAPLVALGLAHPEGHELLGKAEYAIMLLANIFLRPLLMIFGFIVATILSSVMLWLLNYGFTQAWQTSSQPDMIRVIYFVATIIVYMTLVLTIINKCFALIYEVPNKVLRWVGGQIESTGEGAALDEVKGGVGKGLDTVGSTAEKGMDQVYKGASQANDAMKKKAEKNEGAAESAGGAGGGLQGG